MAVFELERITGVAELNEGCRRARLLRDRCCHGDTNPVLRQFTISTRALHRSLRPPGKARSISAITRSHVSMAILYRDKKGSSPFPLRPHGFQILLFSSWEKICPNLRLEWKNRIRNRRAFRGIKIPIYAIDTL